MLLREAYDIINALVDRFVPMDNDRGSEVDSLMDRCADLMERIEAELGDA